MESSKSKVSLKISPKTLYKKSRPNFRSRERETRGELAGDGQEGTRRRGAPGRAAPEPRAGGGATRLEEKEMGGA